MQKISLSSLPTLTERSERTLWRWIAEGTLTRAMEAPTDNHDKAMVQLDSVKPHLCIPFEPEDFDLLVNADAGDAESQNDLALIFLANGKPKNAIYWLNLAAEQGYADAMHWLARCHLDGNGVAQDDNLGIMWLAKAAAHDHAISRAQMQLMREKALGKS